MIALCLGLSLAHVLANLGLAIVSSPRAVIGFRSGIYPDLAVATMASRRC